MSVPDPDPDMPSDLITALELARLAGAVERHPSISDKDKARWASTLLDGAQRLAWAVVDQARTETPE